MPVPVEATGRGILYMAQHARPDSSNAVAAGVTQMHPPRLGTRNALLFFRQTHIRMDFEVTITVPDTRYGLAGFTAHPHQHNDLAAMKLPMQLLP